jgi:hypothetical protein
MSGEAIDKSTRPPTGHKIVWLHPECERFYLEVLRRSSRGCLLFPLSGDWLLREGQADFHRTEASKLVTGWILTFVPYGAWKVRLIPWN